MKNIGLVCTSVLFMFLFFSQTAHAYYSNQTYTNRINPYFATSPRYDYIYANPPKPSLQAYGRYIKSTGGARYLHSPSRLKGVRHAARINANNRYAYGY